MNIDETTILHLLGTDLAKLCLDIDDIIGTEPLKKFDIDPSEYKITSSSAPPITFLSYAIWIGTIIKKDAVKEIHVIKF